jgi:hypothetical protein
MNSQIDSSIPVLTEVITAPHSEASIEATTKGTEEASPLATATEIPAPLEKIAVALPSSIDTTVKIAHETTPEALTQHSSQLSEEQLQHLENKLREDILSQVLQRVDFVLEHRIRDGLADVLQSAVDDLAEQIRAGMRVSLEELVRRSVNQELSKIKLSK